MTNINNKLNRLVNTKNKIKNVINYSTPNIITEETSFKEYPKKIKKEFVKIVNNGTDELYNNLPKIQAENDNNLFLDNCENITMQISLKGNINQSSKIIPENYTQVDYIQSSGTQYIDSGVIGNGNIGFDIEWETNDAQTIFGSRTSYNLNQYQLTTYKGSGMENGYFGYGNGGSEKWNKIYYNYNKKNHISFINNLLTLDDGTTKTIAYQNFNTPKTITIFALQGPNGGISEKTSSKLYNLKFYEKEKIIRNFVPCYRNDDNEIGLYDTINNIFYTNIGTGTFTYGNIVNILDPMKPQSIKVATGEQNIELQGKNLFNKNKDIIDKAYLPMDINNTQIRSISETAAFTSKILIIKLEEGKTYTIQKISSARFRFGFTNTSTPAKDTNNVITSRLSNADTSSKVTFTVPYGSPYFVCNFFSSDRSADAQKGYDMIVNTIQVEEGSVATSYNSYYEPQKYSINLGKNLFDKDNANIIPCWVDYSSSIDKNVIQGPDNNNRTLYIKCEPNTTYTISRSILTSTFRVATYDEIPFPTFTEPYTYYDISNFYKDENATSITITTGLNSKFLLVNYGKTSDENLEESLVTIQIEKGDTATPYVPYITPIELYKIGNNKDYIFKNEITNPFYNTELENNSWYKVSKIGKTIFETTDDFAEGRIREKTFLTWARQKINNCKRKRLNTNIVSNRFSGLNVYSNDETGIVAHYPLTDAFSYVYIAISKDIANNLENFKEWLKNNETILYYELENPIYEKITNNILIQQLEYINKNIKSYSGTTIIKCNNIDDNENLIINATAIKNKKDW